ncbi:MAG: hypothetical protein ACJ8AS_00680 [Hyphomicrobiales bacterium]
MPASKFTLFRESALAAVAAIAACSAIASSGLAHDTLTDLGGTVERGAVNAFTSNSTARPWVRKYFASANSKLCLEVSQVSPFADLEMVVVEPNPRITVRDDDSGDQCTNCPRLAIDPTPDRGYYTVIINQFAGSPANADFILQYWRVASGAKCPNDP